MKRPMALITITMVSGVVLAAPALSPADIAAAFTAAGFVKRGAQWRSDCDDPGTAGYTPGKLETARDLNGDGRPEAVITEGSTYCYGGDETGYTIVSRQPNGSWRRVTSNTGVPNFLPTKGVGGWPDIEVGGQGFCFPVERWNGATYALIRHQYEGKACRPN